MAIVRQKYMYMRISDLTEEQYLLARTIYPETDTIKLSDGDSLVAVGILANLAKIRVKDPLHNYFLN